VLKGYNKRKLMQ